MGDFLVEFEVGGGLLLLLLAGAAAGGEGLVGARAVVVAAARGVRERVVGVVYLLEALCAGGAFGAVCGDAVGVVLEGLSGRRVRACGGKMDGWGTHFL